MYPHERSLVETHSKDSFAILGVNSDGDLADLKPVLARERITWHSFWNGSEGTQGPISRAWNVRGWPTVYVLDRDGVIRYKSVGANEDAIDAAIEECLAAKVGGAREGQK